MTSTEALNRISLLLADVELRAKLWEQSAEVEYQDGNDLRFWEHHRECVRRAFRESRYPFGLLNLCE